jgi:hypothetical protein
VQWVALAGLAALVGVCFSGVLRGDVLFAGDLHLTFEPFRHLLAEAHRAGSLLWTDRVHNGAPLLANPVHQPLYPPNLTASWLEPARGQSVVTLLHMLWSALGGWLLARHLGCSRAASWTAGGVVALNGVGLSATRLMSLSWSAAWVPWLLLACVRIDQRRRGATLGLVAVGVMVVLAGEPFVLLAGLLGVAVFLTESVLRERARWRSAVRVAGALAVAGALCAPWLVIVLRWTAASVRGQGFVAEAVTLWSMHPVAALGLVLPHPFGDPAAFGIAGFWAHALVAPKAGPVFPGLYLGSVVVALAVVGLLRSGPLRRPCTVWAVLLLLLAAGRYGPLYPVLVELPGSGSLRYPIKWLLALPVPVGLLAGSGLDSLVARVRQGGRTLVAPAVVSGVYVLAVAAVALGLVWGGGTLVSWLGPETEPISAIWAAARSSVGSSSGWSVSALVLAALVVVLLVRSEGARVAGWVVALVAVVDLCAANRRLVPTTPLDLMTAEPAVVAALREQPEPVGRVWVDPEWPPGLGPVPVPADLVALSRWQRETLRGYTGLSFGLRYAMTTDVEAMTLHRYARLQHMVSGAPARERAMVLGAAGVTHLVSFRAQPSAVLEQVAAVQVGASAPLKVFRNHLAVPRCRVVPRAVPCRGLESCLQTVLRSPDDLFSESTLLDAGAGAACPVGDGGFARVTSERGGTLEVATAGGGGWLVVSDTLTPGWRAEMDGQPVPLVRADLVFRGVCVPAGEHVVRMQYSPW